MKFWNATATDLLRTVEYVSHTYFDGNLIIKDCKEFGTKVKGVNFTLRVKGSKGKGARASWSGRRSVSACVHATDAVIRGLFTLYPKSKCQTLGITFHESEGYEDNWEYAFRLNCGSQINPVPMCECCDCPDAWHRLEEKRQRTLTHTTILNELRTATRFATDPLFVQDYFPPILNTGLYVQAVCPNRENANGYQDWMMDQGGNLVSRSDAHLANVTLHSTAIKIIMELPL